MKISTYIRLCFLSGVLFLIQGCGTILSGTNQSINIKVVESGSLNLLQNCKCVVTDGAGGNYILMSNPGSVVVSRSSGMVQVNCSKDGYSQLNTSVGDSFNATTLINVLFWPGFIVDAASGAYKKYPSHYIVSMQKNAK